MSLDPIISIKDIQLTDLPSARIENVSAGRSYGRRFKVILTDPSTGAELKHTDDVIMKDLYKSVKKLAKNETDIKKLESIKTFLTQLKQVEKAAKGEYKERGRLYRFRTWFHRIGDWGSPSHSKTIRKLEEDISSKQLLHSAVGLWNNNVDLEGILDKLFELHSNEEKETFLLYQDANGKTLFHHLAENKVSLQQATLDNLYSNLEPGLVKKCFLLQNSSEESPLDVAVARGQMAVISRLFPIPPNESSLEWSELEKQQIVKGLDRLILILGDPEKQAELLEACPGEMNYDKMNHIISAIQALACYGMEPSFDAATTQIINNLPCELPLLFAEPDRVKTRYEELCKECTELTTKAAVNQKMEDWNLIDPPKINPASFISLINALKKDPDNALMGIIDGALKSEKLEDRNAYLNHLAFFLNPYAAYDQKIDFSDIKYADTLHRVIDMKLENEDLDIGPIVNMLVLKFPDFLERKNADGQTVSEYLETKNHPEIKVIETVQSDLGAKLFENRLKKQLKYYLNRRFVELT